jgi:aryl-alcohol dehydrogenase-like predicted oxidoreductase
MQQISHITMGTVQLGLPYGIANKTGIPDSKSAEQILNLAYDNGINTFDTAKVYGNSEAVIGKWIRERSPEVNIITKISSELDSISDIREFKLKLRTSIEDSLQKLSISTLWGLFFHSISTLKRFPHEALDIMTEMKKDGMCNNIGVSVYSSGEAVYALSFNEINCIQVPVNILDQRFLTIGMQSLYKEKECFLFARSILLQGLLCLDSQEADLKIPGAGQYLNALKKLSKDYGISIQEMAIKFVQGHKFIHSLVLGMETPEQLENNLTNIRSNDLPEALVNEIKLKFDSVPANINDPRTWQTRN